MNPKSRGAKVEAGADWMAKRIFMGSGKVANKMIQKRCTRQWEGN